jgi:Putative Ig domain/Bacterial Ig domain
VRHCVCSLLLVFVVVAGCSDPLDPDSLGRNAAAGSVASSGGWDAVQSAASGSISIRAASTTYVFGLKWQLFADAGCTGTASTVRQFPSVTSSGITLLMDTWLSVQLTAADASSLGDAFAGWSGTDGSSSTDPSICVVAPVTDQIYTAHYGQSTNSPPVLNPIGDLSVDEDAPLSFSATATDAETPAASLVFSLNGAPIGAAITTGGDFTWTPTEAQGPGQFPFTVCVIDDATPPSSDCEFVVVTVNEVNGAPVLPPMADVTVEQGTPIQLNVSAVDGDLPANVLTYALQGAPPGAAIDGATGSFSWTPVAAGDFAFTVVVHDGGTPDLSDSQTLNVHVLAVAPEILDVSPPDGTALSISQAIEITGRFTAPGSGDEANCVAMAVTGALAPVMGTTGSGTGTCTSSLQLDRAGIYEVSYEVTGLDGRSDRRVFEIVAYDEQAGSFTASGWIRSQAGTMRGDPDAAGRTLFTFVSRYKRKADRPDGVASVQMHDAHFNFRGTTQDWLVVDPASSTAELCGRGEVLGMPGTFGFRVFARQGQHDQPGSIRIVIWQGSDPADVIYDTGQDGMNLEVGSVSVQGGH